MGSLANAIHCRDCQYIGPLRKEELSSFVITLPYISQTTMQQLVLSIANPIYLQDYHCDMCTIIHTIENYKKKLDGEKYLNSHQSIDEKTLVDLCLEIKSHYDSIDENQKRNLDLMEKIPVTLKDLFTKKKSILGSVKISGFLKVISSKCLFEI